MCELFCRGRDDAVQQNIGWGVVVSGNSIDSWAEYLALAKSARAEGFEEIASWFDELAKQEKLRASKQINERPLTAYGRG